MYVLDRESLLAAMNRKGIRSFSELARRTGVHRNTLGRFISSGEPVLPDSLTRVFAELELEPSSAITKAEKEGDPLTSPEFVSFLDQLVVFHPRAAYALFGSRARNEAKRYSDLDLGVFSREGITLDKHLELIDIKERFEDESPWLVDLINLNTADQEFIEKVSADLKFLAGRYGDWLALKEQWQT